MRHSVWSREKYIFSFTHSSLFPRAPSSSLSELDLLVNRHVDLQLIEPAIDCSLNLLCKWPGKEGWKERIKKIKTTKRNGVLIAVVFYRVSLVFFFIDHLY